MNQSKAINTNQSESIHRSDGITSAERYLKKLCDNTFLSLWSYSGTYRDQGSGGEKGGHGKEVCDLLVVFKNHIIIFSDKECKFPNTGNLELDWSRWFRKAIQKSAEQVWGAERWIKSHPDSLFIDRACTKPFPIELPSPDNAIIYRIVVAHGASKRCRKELGGSGSFMIDSNLIGEMHHASIRDGGKPFTIGQINPIKGYVHVFDDVSLDIIMSTLDTITDFIAYLSKKEILIRCNHPTVFAAGEEELLAIYLENINEDNEHDFIIPSGTSKVHIEEGRWESFVRHPQRQAQLDANQISYTWDALIETFNKHILAGTQYYGSLGVANQEKVVRFLAAESRTRRRALAKSLIELIEKTPKSYRATRIAFSSNPSYPLYLFLLLPHPESVPYSQYRKVRRELLYTYCTVAKLEFPNAQEIIGIATETGMAPNSSEDAIYYDAKIWGPDDQIEAQENEKMLKELDILDERTLSAWWAEKEYPDPSNSLKKSSNPDLKSTARYPRNKPCFCGSGKKYKRCHGKR